MPCFSLSSLELGRTFVYPVRYHSVEGGDGRIQRCQERGGENTNLTGGLENKNQLFGRLLNDMHNRKLIAVRKKNNLVLSVPGYAFENKNHDSKYFLYV